MMISDSIIVLRAGMTFRKARQAISRFISEHDQGESALIDLE